MEHKNNIIHDAYYLISLFNNDDRTITQLQVQKLMYFFEAYYMNIHEDESSLYDCNFNAWAFGPVAIPLYKEFRKFGNGPISLTEQNKEDGNSITDDKKQLLKEIYVAFKDVPPMNLVKITHMQDSPWDKVWKRNGNKVGYGANTYIDKLESKEWFGNIFGKQ